MSIYTGRRSTMYNPFLPPISIEKFAAYLEGNLPENEMLHVSLLIESNDDMRQIMQINDFVDEAMEANDFIDMDLPDGIMAVDFELPDINNVDELFYDIDET